MERPRPADGMCARFIHPAMGLLLRPMQHPRVIVASAETKPTMLMIAEDDFSSRFWSGHLLYISYVYPQPFGDT